ncbi:MAG: glycosyltransferase [Flavobacteriales bacterium]
MQKPIRVGISSNSYLEKRNFTGLPFDIPVLFKKCIDTHKAYNHLLFRFLKKIDPNHQYTFRQLPTHRVDLFHFFSSVCSGKKPWVVTTSVPMPRWTKHHKHGHNLLAGSACKKIIFISECAFSSQLKKMDYSTDLQEQIRLKSMLMHPAQPVLLNHPEQKKPTEPVINFALIGHQVLIKGGYEILRVFERLHAEKYPIHLTLISALHNSSYLDAGLHSERMAYIKKIIDSRPAFLSYHTSMENDRVVDLLKKEIHVSLLPSYADSYGYSVLEGQACGCPVLSTDIVALPEINNDQCGWMIQVPEKVNGRPDLSGKAVIKQFSEFLENELYHKIKAIAENASEIKTKSAASISRINLQHNPVANAKMLQNVYLSILNKNSHV